MCPSVPPPGVAMPVERRLPRCCEDEELMLSVGSLAGLLATADSAHLLGTTVPNGDMSLRSAADRPHTAAAAGAAEQASRPHTAATGGA
eukprot:CAMPEP_0171066506 /NCGR_PEP_ID=MMETSP0766_2-20121228/7462_1 /TAXON_ID=439317 /ORGANISM="Gambierdiscus australes, Strain CAWD 149" /LENGTH=88 /DNA_ID=CAMNT_0011522687 /DNA_START=24 /DNA_END=287 /DNA_ORIENTATION=-